MINKELLIDDQYIRESGWVRPIGGPCTLTCQYYIRITGEAYCKTPIIYYAKQELFHEENPIDNDLIADERKVLCKKQLRTLLLIDLNKGLIKLNGKEIPVSLVEINNHINNNWEILFDGGSSNEGEAD